MGEVASWVTAADLPQLVQAAGGDTAIVDTAAQAATAYLAAVTGRFTGVVQAVHQWKPAHHAATQPAGRLHLPGRPVRAVQAITHTVDGTDTPLPYDLLPGGVLDLPRWCGLLRVAYEYGETIADGGASAALAVAAVKALTPEFAVAVSGGSCAVKTVGGPAVQSVVRQGLTVGYVDGSELAAVGRTGITAVDRFIETYKVKKRATHWHIDEPVQVTARNSL